MTARAWDIAQDAEDAARAWGFEPLPRDRDERSQSEDPRSGAEAEGRQPGPKASPKINRSPPNGY